MHIVYVLFSETRDRYYIGVTEDITERIRRHNTRHAGFTGNTSDWKAVWTQEFNDKSEALKVERKIKRWKSRKMIEQFQKVRKI